jgi:hypothetical protein
VTLKQGDRKGGGSAWSIPSNEVNSLRRLVNTVSTPLKSKSITRKITKLMDRIPTISVPTLPYFSGPALQFDGFEYDTIYTDGSWKESGSLRDHLSGRRVVEAGGAVVLCKGDKYLCIHIEIDLDNDSAFEIEMISLLVAMDIAAGADVTIFSDCKSALSLFWRVITGVRSSIFSRDGKNQSERY